MYLQAVSFEEGLALAKEFDLPFFEASAKQYLNVEEIFTAIVTDVKNRLVSEGSTGSSGNNGLRLNQANTTTAPKQKGCC